MSASYDNDAIKGEQLEVLATEIAKRLLSDGSVVAEALNSLAIRLESVERGLSEIGNASLGERGLVSLMTSNASDSENFAATPKSVKTAYDSLNGSKQNKLSTAQQSAVDSGITTSKRSSYDTHIADAGIHVTNAQKEAWDGKAEANGYYPDMSVGGADHSEVSAAVKDYNDSSSLIKIGYAGASLSSCTMLAAYTQLDGGTKAIKDIPVNLVKVGGSSKADNADYSTKSGFSVNFANINGNDSGVAIRDAVPFIRFIAGTRTMVARTFPKALTNAVSFSFTNAYLLILWEVQLENVYSDGIFSFTLYNTAPSTKEELYSSAVFVKAGSSSIMLVMPALLTGNGNKQLQLWISDADQGGREFYVTSKGTLIKINSNL